MIGTNAEAGRGDQKFDSFGSYGSDRGLPGQTERSTPQGFPCLHYHPIKRPFQKLIKNRPDSRPGLIIIQ